MTVTVKILHNTTGREYVNGDQLTQAIEFQSPYPACGHVKMLLQIIWRQLNEAPSTEWGKKYRRQGHRGLAVGDVIVINNQPWAIQRFGWKPVIVHQHQINEDAAKPQTRGRLSPVRVRTYRQGLSVVS